jgi:BlaI family penicillinase repressor
MLMPPIPQISDAEWEVMKALWTSHDLTAGQIVDLVAAEQKWRPRTIKTLLARLVKKEAVAVETDGRKFVYRARVQRDAVIRRETKSFLSRVFDGAAAPAIVHFLDNAKLSPEEIQKLRERLDREANT